jgi:Zn-dependent peptidase ImmA (M78 family)
MDLQNNRPNYENAKKKAEILLKENSITQPPVLLYKIAKNYELDVFNANFNKYKDKVSGVLDIDQKTIYINNEDKFKRQRFTVAHELGHWFLHKNTIEKDKSQYKVLLRQCSILKEDLPYLEKEANCFAANLLVPKKFLDKHKKMSNPELSDLFKVSEEVIKYRKKFEEYNR